MKVKGEEDVGLTTYSGHVFAGATLPFGLAKAVADSVNDNAGGYASDGGPSMLTLPEI